MSAEETRQEQTEKMEELKQTEDWSGQSNRFIGALSRKTGWRYGYGGWLASSFVSGTDNDRDGKTQDVLDHSWEDDFRIFATAQDARGKTKLYFRAGTLLVNSSAISSAVRKTDWTQSKLDMFYIERSYGNTTLQEKLTLGRQFVKVKNSLAFGQVADGLKFELISRQSSWESFFLLEMAGTDNVDFLSPNAGRSKRLFYGMQYSLKYLPSQNLNFFSVWNRDRNPERPDPTGQRYQLDSVYLGGTFFGMLMSRLEYEAQYIQELGRTYPNFTATNPATTGKVSINAHALDCDFKYYFNSDLKPVLHAGYTIGSGDGDAVGNTFSTKGGSGSLLGSADGGKDNRFISFGGKNLGYALAPTVTNLQVFKSGFSFKPFGASENRLWNDLKVHPQFYIYKRDRTSGATSDPYIFRGAGASREVGKEMDLSIAWRLMSDVSYSLKIGRFFPSAAYTTHSHETFLRMKISVDL